MLKVIELFAGIGSQTQALKNIGIEHEVIGISEIDKWTIKAYEQLHGKVNNFGDITKIESLFYCDLLTYSFPCQDLSIAGKQQGIKEGTRSGLLFEVERLLNGMTEKPKYLLLENVKNLISEKFYSQYQEWLNKLSGFGYVNYSMLLNAKDYDIPQNGERVFCVSIRKDVDKYFWIPNKIKMKKLNEIIPDCIFIYDRNYLKSRLKLNDIRKYFKCCPTIMTTNQLYINNERKITPTECLKLMGFNNEINKIKNIPDKNIYYIAGNSIVVNVLEKIFTNLLK